MKIISVFLVAALALAGCGKAPVPGGKKVAIGFLVKQPEEAWFQQEWRFAQQCADQYGFELVKIGATDGEKVLAAIDSLAVKGAQGFVICTPDVKLGPAIVSKATTHGMKLISVDDQFVGPDGKFMDVVYMGISARQIGGLVGRSLWAELQRRGWSATDTAACAVTFDELDTGRERTEGAIAALVTAGFPADKIYRAAEKTTDTEGAFNAAGILLTQHPEVKRWLAFALNDEGVLGAVRAFEGRGFGPANVIGIGIGGSTALGEFQKDQSTGFFATVLLSPRRHGFETTELLYRWIKDGIAPPKTTYTDGVLITRENYRAVMKENGLSP